MNTTTQTKQQALSTFLSEELDSISESSYCDSTFEIGSREYLVLTDSEADERAKASILDTAWAFNKSFLDAHSKAINALTDKAYGIFQEGCESSNEAVMCLIDDKDHFAEDAIACDGRGHFLSGYDGEENQEGEFFIYRIN